MSSHDEAIVVDNGPVRVHLGRRGDPTQELNSSSWKRHFYDELHSLIVVGIADDGNVVRAESYQLVPDKPLEIHFKGITAPLIFRPDPGNHLIHIEPPAGRPMVPDEAPPDFKLKFSVDTLLVGHIEGMHYDDEEEKQLRVPHEDEDVEEFSHTKLLIALVGKPGNHASTAA